MHSYGPCLQFIVESSPGHAVSLAFIITIVTGVLLGGAGAYLLGRLLQHHHIPYYLQNVFTLVLVLMVFTVSNAIHHESGLLAVTLMGMILANMRDIDIEDILFFKESLSVLLISVLFILLAARLEFAPLVSIGWAAVGMLAVILFVARPIAVFTATIGSKLDWRARVLIGWVAPRGIVAAAVSALFALRLDTLGYQGAEYLVPLTFFIIVGTVLLQGSTARALAQRLNVTSPEPVGVLIVGANAVARTIASALESQGFTTKLADTGWENVSAARMQGLDTYFGRVVSEHADRRMDLTGIGKLLALSPHSTLNALACIHFKAEFGTGNIFRLQTSEEEKIETPKARSPTFAGRILFGDGITHTKLASLISQGASVHITTLSQDFDYTDYTKRYSQGAIPLIAIDTQGKLSFITPEETTIPKQGWKLASLFPADLSGRLSEMPESSQ